MKDIESFARDREMTVRTAGGGALSVTVGASDLVVEVTVAEAVHEWFIAVRDAATGEQVFEDWCDHQGYEQVTRDDLQRELYEAVTAFLSAVQGATLRVRRLPGSFGVTRLELRTDTGWINVWDLTPGAEPTSGN